METKTISFSTRTAKPLKIEIATSGENKVREVVFDFSGNPALQILANAVPVISIFEGATLLEEKELAPIVDGKCTLPVTDQITSKAGKHTASIKFVGAAGEVWGSKNFWLTVENRVDGDGQVAPLIDPSIVVQVTAKAQQVAEDTDEVAENTLTVEQKAAQATQALADLLAMLGTDVATLTGGKLTPSQIPAITITNTSVVNSEAAMLALDAQTGDLCIRMDEAKSYILQGDDPAVLANWQRLQSPTNYADTAGHAATADEAENANTINGHRVVYMTQAQYDVAVKDPDTIYLVGVS